MLDMIINTRSFQHTWRSSTASYILTPLSLGNKITSDITRTIYVLQTSNLPKFLVSAAGLSCYSLRPDKIHNTEPSFSHRHRLNHGNRGSVPLRTQRVPGAVSACPTCFPVLVHADGPGLRNLSVLQTVVDVGGLPTGVLPVLDVLGEVEHRET